MATFFENIDKIRGTAVRGPEMRTAIADAILQAIDLDIGGSSDGTVLFSLAPIPGVGDDYLLTFVNEDTGGAVPS